MAVTYYGDYDHLRIVDSTMFFREDDAFDREAYIAAHREATLVTQAIDRDGCRGEDCFCEKSRLREPYDAVTRILREEERWLEKRIADLERAARVVPAFAD